MSVFTHLNEEGHKIYEEVVHELESVEAWINQHFGSAPIPEGHTILKDGEPVTPAAEKPAEAEHHEEAPKAEEHHEEAPKAEEHHEEAPKAEEHHEEEHKDEAPVPGPENLLTEAKE